MAKVSFQLREEIKAGGVHIVDGIDISLIEIVVISLSILCTSGDGKGFQLVFIDGLAPKAICLSVRMIAIGCTIIVFSIARCLDICTHDIRCQRLMAVEVLMEVEVE